MEKKKQPCAEITTALWRDGLLARIHIRSCIAFRATPGARDYPPRMRRKCLALIRRGVDLRSHTLHVDEKHGAGFSPAGRLAGIKRRIAA